MNIRDMVGGGENTVAVRSGETSSMMTIPLSGSRSVLGGGELSNVILVLNISSNSGMKSATIGITTGYISLIPPPWSRNVT